MSDTAALGLAVHAADPQPGRGSLGLLRTRAGLRPTCRKLRRLSSFGGSCSRSLRLHSAAVGPKRCPPGHRDAKRRQAARAKRLHIGRYR
jgi:hypothetical protein